MGDFNLQVSGAYVLLFERAFTKTAPRVDIVNTVYNPLARRLRGTVEWRRHPAPNSDDVRRRGELSNRNGRALE